MCDLALDLDLSNRGSFLRTVVSSKYHISDGMKGEATVVPLDVPKQQLILKKTFPELKRVTTKELVALQARFEGDVSTIYNCVLTEATLDANQLANASYELKTLHGRLSLLRINSDGLLLIGVLIGGQAREVIVCPLPYMKKLLERCTDKIIKA